MLCQLGIPKQVDHEDVCLNIPIFATQSRTTTSPAIAVKKPKAMIHPSIRVRRCFFRFLSSHESICFKGGGFEDELEVEVVSEMFPFSSSICTAIEKRFQNAGSRTPAMAIVGLWCNAPGRDGIPRVSRGGRVAG